MQEQYNFSYHVFVLKPTIHSAQTTDDRHTQHCSISRPWSAKNNWI